MRNIYSKIVILVLVIMACLYSSTANDVLPMNAPKIYIDCDWCDMDFIKTEITFVNYVIDRKVADIYVLITTRYTASRGIKHTITFVGQRSYRGMNDTLYYISGPLDTEDIVRTGIVKKLKLGLIRYVAKSSVADNITIENIETLEEVYPIIPEDKWRSWVFSIGIDGYLTGEQTMNFRYISGSLSANKITEEWKTMIYTYYDYDKSNFEIDDTITISSLSKNYGLSGLIVKSLTDHWSTGGSIYIYSSTYTNKEIVFTGGPAIEYNIFPYSQATNKELTLYYELGYEYNQYIEETIYDKMEEKLFYEYASITLDVTQRWGSICTILSGSHYFHDFEKNSLNLSSVISLPIAKGFTFELTGQTSMIHDQLSLPKRDLTPEEILLQIKQVSTQYDYSLSVGLTYTFGSLYSNIVNPRFGY